MNGHDLDLNSLSIGLTYGAIRVEGVVTFTDGICRTVMNAGADIAPIALARLSP